MKKAMIIMAMMVMMVGMAAVGNAGYWDDKTVAWLKENTISWCNENGYEKWTEALPHFEDDMVLGIGIVTKGDSIFYDATPSTITNQIYVTRIEETLETELYSIETMYCGQEGGYDIYRLIVKWNEPVIMSVDLGQKPVYGIDVFVRFYN